MAMPGNNENLTSRSPSFMDQIWETLMQINAFVDKLQKTQMATRVESLSNFVEENGWKT